MDEIRFPMCFSLFEVEKYYFEVDTGYVSSKLGIANQAVKIYFFSLLVTTVWFISLSKPLSL